MLVTFLCWFVVLSAVVRLVFRPRASDEELVPTTVAEALASPIPMWWDVDRCTVDEDSGGTILNSAAARFHMMDAPLHPAVLAMDDCARPAA